MSPSDKQLQYLSLALKGAGCGLWDWNVATGEVSFDSSFFLISGYEPDEFPHHLDEWRKRIHPQDLGPIEREIQKYLSGEIKTFAIEFRFKRKSGDWMWILGKGETTERDDAGNPVRFMGLHIDITERKLAEQALHDSEAKLTSILRSAPVGIGQVTDREINFVNERFAQVLGYSVSELMGKNSRFVYPSDAEFERVGQYKYEEIKKKGTGSIETILQKKDGTLIDVFLSSTPVDLDDLSQGVTFTALDITERKQTEAAIEKGRAEIEAIFNCITDGIVFVDQQRRILRINAAFTKIFGYQIDELAGQTTKLIYANPEHYGQQGQKRYNPEAKVDRPVYEDEYRRKDGTTFFAETIGVHVVDESGTLLGYIGVIHDITERKKAEQKNKAYQQQLLTILNSIDANVYVSDLETNEVLFMNKNMIQDFGKDLTGETCWEVFRSETAPCDDCKNQLLLDENGQPTSGCVWESKNAVTGKDYINHDRAIEWMDGRLVHLQVSTDISHRKSMEQQLRQKYKMEAVGIMAGGMAHNFNNNLSIILGNLELAKMKMALNPEVDGYLTNAKIAVHRSTDLIQKIVTYSRQGDHEKVAIQLSLVIKETLKLFRSTMPTTMNLKQHISSDSHDLMVQVDTSQVQECLINLLNNAMHAMDEEGNLTVTLENVELQQHDIPAHYDCHPGHYAKLSVQDSGTGMSAETIDKIFDLFFTTKPVDQGTGVGLSTVQGIVAEHGGMINVNSTLGEGSTFELYFPSVQETQTSSTSPTNTEIPSGTGHILLVDDDPMLATLGERMLETKGYTVTTMTDSVEALKLFTVNADRIDLLITDQTMPGLTGEHLIEEIKKIKPTIPTIICTGYSSKMDEKKAAQLGASAFLMKPLDMPKLLQTVRQVLDGKEG